MKHIPFIFPLTLAVIVAVTFFASVWAVAESAVNGRRTVWAEHVAVLREATGAGALDGSADYEWYERAAIYVCPLH